MNGDAWQPDSSDLTADLIRPPDKPAEVIDDYEILRELHRGAQGIVYVALQRSTKRKVALKVLLGERPVTKAARQRFEREIEVIAQLKHPSIISIYHSGVTKEGLPYFAMDYVHGEALVHFVRTHDLDLDRTLALFADVCDAVQHAHQRGVIHRDLKPSNILVDSEGHPYVLDFGLAKLIAAPVRTLVTMTGEVLGTLRYMSPEHVRGNPEEIDTRSDIYSLGVILYEILSGQFPFSREERLADIVRDVLETAPVAPSTQWISGMGVRATSLRGHHVAGCPIDNDVDTIVLRALSKERERRYQSVGELARDLRHRLAGEPIEAKRDNRGYLLRMALYRHKAEAFAGSLFVLLILGAAIITSALYFRAETARSSERVQRTLAEEREELANRHLYAAHMYLAQQEWERGNVDRARALLLSHRHPGAGADLRSFEWDYLWRLCNSELHSLPHDEVVYAVAYSPQGTLLATASQGKVQLWNAESGALERRLSGPAPLVFVFGLAFSPHGDLLAAGGDDQTVRLWEIETGKQIASSKVGEIRGLAFSPDGSRIAVAGGSANGAMLKVLSSPSLEPLLERTGKEEFTLGIAFAPNGQTLATVGTDALVRMWDARTGEIVGELPTARAPKSSVAPLAFSPDGRVLAAGAASAGGASIVEIWDVTTREKLASLVGHRDTIATVAFSRNGRLLLSAGKDNSIKLWDAGRWELVSTFRGHAGTINALAFSPRDDTFASAGHDRAVKLWDANTRQEPPIIAATSKAVLCAALSPDGALLATGGIDKQVRLWDLQSGVQRALLTGHRYPILKVAFSPDGALLVTSSVYRGGKCLGAACEADSGSPGVGELKVWDLTRSAENAADRTGTDAVDSFAIAPDGQTLATVDMTTPTSQAVTILDFPALRRRKTFSVRASEPPKLAHVAYSSDGTRVAAAGLTGSAFLWDLASGEDHALNGHSGRVALPAFSPDSRMLATAGDDATVRLWDARNGQLIRMAPEQSQVIAMAFCPDGKTIATASLDGTITLRDVETWDVRGTWQTQSGMPFAIAFAADGRTLIAVGESGVQVWNAAQRPPDSRPNIPDAPMGPAPRP